MPLTNGSTSRAARPARGRDDTASTIIVGDLARRCRAPRGAGPARRGCRCRPPSRPSGRSKIGLPAAGGVHDDSATPNERARSLTRRAIAGHRRDVVAALGRRARDLLGQHGRADAAAARGVERVLHGDVVVDQHGLDVDPLVGGVLGRQLEVHDVARVVLDDVHDAGAAVDGLRRREHLVGHRRGEHLARAGRVEHPEPDEAAVQRLVARAAAGDEGDLALHAARRRARRSARRRRRAGCRRARPRGRRATPGRRRAGSLSSFLIVCVAVAMGSSLTWRPRAASPSRRGG